MMNDSGGCKYIGELLANGMAMESVPACSYTGRLRN